MKAPGKLWKTRIPPPQGHNEMIFSDDRRVEHITGSMELTYRANDHPDEDKNRVEGVNVLNR